MSFNSVLWIYSLTWVRHPLPFLRKSLCGQKEFLSSMSFEQCSSDLPGIFLGLLHDLMPVDITNNAMVYMEIYGLLKIQNFWSALLTLASRTFLATCVAFLHPATIVCGWILMSINFSALHRKVKNKIDTIRINIPMKIGILSIAIQN